MTFVFLAKEEAEQINEFADEESKKFKAASNEIKSLHAVLKDGVEHWKRYNGCYDTLVTWVDDGEQLLQSGDKDQIEEFFTEIPQYEERLKFMNESATFLIENCQPPIAAEIQQNAHLVNQRFNALTDGYQHFKKVEVIGKGKKQYQEGVDRISQWLKNAEELLAQEVPCQHAALKEHLQDVDVRIVYYFQIFFA